MIDFREIEIKIVDGLQAELDKTKPCSVIRANQTGPIPSYPYVSYTVITPQSANKGTWGSYDDGFDRQSFTQTWSITVQSDSSEDSLNLAIQAKNWFEHVGRYYLNANDIIVQSVENITNRDNLITIEYEYRNGFDVVFYLMDEVESVAKQIEPIDKIEFNGGNS